MKKHAPFYMLLFLSFQLSAQDADTTIRKVYVGFNYAKDIFPPEWRNAPISATGDQMDHSEISRCKVIISKALNKYPEALLQFNLKSVYFVKNMKFYEVGFGGTNSNNAVYVANEGIAAAYTDKYLEQTFHHEFSSILFRKYPTLIDTMAWKAANIAGFIYNDPENGVGAIRNNQSSQELDTLLCQRGILTQYGGSSLENDINTFAQNLFCPEKNFWANVDHFFRIRKKTSLLINFYGQLSAMYTELYFRQMGKQ